MLRQAGRLLSSTTSSTYHLAGKGHVDGVAVGLHLPTTREFQEEHHDELMGSVDHVPLTPVIVHSFSNKHRRFRNGREGVVREQESRTPRPIILGRSTMMIQTASTPTHTCSPQYQHYTHGQTHAHMPGSPNFLAAEISNINSSSSRITDRGSTYLLCTCSPSIT